MKDINPDIETLARSVVEGKIVAFPRAARPPETTASGESAADWHESAFGLDVKDAQTDGPSGRPPKNRDADGDDGDGGSELAEFNRTHALILVPPRALMIRENLDIQSRSKVQMASIGAFKDLYANRTIKREYFSRDPKNGNIAKKIVNERIVDAWLKWPKRRTYEGTEFFPDPNNIGGTPGYYNFWKGFSYRPDQSPPDERKKKYATFCDHLLVNICNGNEEHFGWVFGWFAHMLQRPRERIGTAIVLRGRQGVGKTIAGDIIGSLFSSNYLVVDDPRYLVGNFNNHLASCLLLQIDEGFWAGDKAAEGRLKGLITSSRQMIEQKGVDPIPLDNYVHLLFTSNENWVSPVGMDGRRQAVFDVAEHARENHEYFATIRSEMKAGGFEALLADLLAYNLDAPGAPNLRVVPKNDALLEQKIRSFEPVPAWWYSRLHDASQTHRASSWRRRIPIQTVYNDYVRWADKIGIRRKSSDTEFGMALDKLVPGLERSRSYEDVEEIGEDGRLITARRRVRCYDFPHIDLCREAFDSAMGQLIRWPASDEPNEEHEDPVE